MAISKDDTVLTYSKFKEFWTSFAVLFNKKLDGTGVANNDTTTDSGYVLDARVGKAHGDEIDTLKDQMNGCYIAYDSDGKLGIKASKNGAVQRFRQPTGTATAAQVLSGATFANASNDNMIGTMPNNGAINKTITPSGNNTASVTIPAGYTSGGTVVADGTTAYKAGQLDSKVYDLGQVVSANVTGLFPDTYKSMTSANFAIAVSSVYVKASRQVTNVTYDGPDTLPVTITYDASTGVVNVTGVTNAIPTDNGKGRREVWTSTCNLTYKLLAFANIS